MDTNRHELEQKSKEELIEMLLQLREKKPIPYNKEWTWVSKIIYALQCSGKPLLNSEICDFLSLHDDYLRTRPDAIKFLSPHLWNGVHYGRILKHKVRGIKGYFYGLPETNSILI
jgi:hypothetical protein